MNVEPTATPELRFFTTDDGVLLAYTLFGSGPVVISIASWSFDMERGTSPDTQAGRLRLARASSQTMLVYDMRGVGASQRDGGEITLERLTEDLAQLIAHVGAERYAVRSGFMAGLVAASYAARRPPGLERLVLTQPFATGSDITTSESARGQIELGRGKWPLAARGLASVTSTGVEQREIARRWVSTLSPEVAAAYIELQSFADVRSEAQRVNVPTLVVYNRTLRLGSVAAATHMASLIRGARLVQVSGFDEVETVIDEFIGVPSPAVGARQAEGETAVILFADIASSTALTERLGDAAFRERSRALDAAIRAAVRESGGTPVEGKVMGDGVMSTFASARQAIEAALRLREAAARHELPLHVGIHAGDVLREGDNVYGGAVNIAARICDASEPGEILVSDIVRGLARTSAGVAFDDRGARDMKGIDEPLRVWAVKEGT